MRQFLKRLIIVGLALYALNAFLSLQMNPLKWNDITRAVYSLLLTIWGAAIYLDREFKNQ